MPNFIPFQHLYQEQKQKDQRLFESLNKISLNISNAFDAINSVTTDDSTIVTQNDVIVTY